MPWRYLVFGNVMGITRRQKFHHTIRHTNFAISSFVWGVGLLRFPTSHERLHNVVVEAMEECRKIARVVATADNGGKYLYSHHVSTLYVEQSFYSY